MTEPTTHLTEQQLLDVFGLGLVSGLTTAAVLNGNPGDEALRWALNMLAVIAEEVTPRG